MSIQIRNPKFGFLLALLFILLSACEDENEVPDRIMPYVLDFEIPTGLNTIETHFFEFDNVQTQIKTFFPEDELPLEDIQLIRPRRAELQLRDPNISFNDIRSVEIRIAQKEEPFRDFEVFYTLNLRQRGRQKINLLPTLSNVKEVFVSDLMEVEVRVNLYRLTSRPIPVLLEMELEALK
ncbi:MAG: hypothetical protein GVX96_06335 [Bacteroidetes bacterium]|jgi:hypothetical protein|nr:hypothetical protein [Bacteroidota bacterium]